MLAGLAIGAGCSSFVVGGTPPARPAGAVPVCSGAAAIDFACHERRYTTLVRRAGPRVALRALGAEQRRNGYVRAGCHQLTHRIGRAAGELRGIDALGDGESVCASGYYHGVLQAVMGRLGPARVVEQAAGVCDGLRSDEAYSALHYNCVHGMGHGFMEVFATNVFASLDGCEALRDPWEREECSGGVFMENVSAIDNPSRPSRDLRPGRPLYPCTALAPRFWEQCYDWQITYALYVHDGDFARVFALCTAGRPAARGPCYRGLGGDVLQQSKFVRTTGGRQATMRRLCALGTTRTARSACVHGAVRNMFRDYVDGDRQARGWCRSLAGARPRSLHGACVRARARAARHVPLPQRSAR